MLLRDDSANARHFMRRVLENLGIRHIIEAADGKEAVALMEETMVDSYRHRLQHARDGWPRVC